MTSRPRQLLSLAALVACMLPHAMTGDSIDAKFRGAWVPAKAACTSPLKLVISARPARDSARQIQIVRFDSVSTQKG